MKNSYKVLARPRLGISDHIMLLLIPTYKSKLKQQIPEVKTVRKWTQEASDRLQDCFDDTNWDIFKDACSDIDEYTDTITSYIKFCYDNCVPSKEVKIRGFDKPWFNSETRELLAVKLKSKDKCSEKKARYDYEKAIRNAKSVFGQKVEKQFEKNESRGAWQGIQTITGYKPRSCSLDPDPELPDKLNDFYGRFDRENKDPPPSIQQSDDDTSPPFIISDWDVKKAFLKQNVNKAAGPDGVPPVVLKSCAHQLSPVFAEVFNISLEQRKVPKCFKTSSIVPVPKKATITRLNDYRPVALTSVIMKVLERFVLNYLRTVTSSLSDPHQFAYRSNRSVDDAVALGIHYMLQHLDFPRTYVRMLFVDYSSAFNTIIPGKLFEKLLHMNVDVGICQWVLDFLLDRPQSVRIGKLTSSSLTLNTGAPQGCVLSPLLFTLFTNDCVSSHESVKMIKFSDDTTLEGLIKDNNECEYRKEVEDLVRWCKDNNLELNVSKTKEIVIDFRKVRTPVCPLTINDEIVEQVESFKFLGTTISHDLKWDSQVLSSVKKANQRIFFLRQLNKFNVNERILMNFYRATIESILTFSITIWFSSLTEEDKKYINRVMKNASKIIGQDVPSLDEIFVTRTIKKCANILTDNTHPSAKIFQILPSCVRFRSVTCKTKRFANSFYPAAIRLLNEQKGLAKKVIAGIEH